MGEGKDKVKVQNGILVSCRKRATLKKPSGILRIEGEAELLNKL